MQMADILFKPRFVSRCSCSVEYPSRSGYELKPPVLRALVLQEKAWAVWHVFQPEEGEEHPASAGVEGSIWCVVPILNVFPGVLDLSLL